MLCSSFDSHYCSRKGKRDATLFVARSVAWAKCAFGFGINGLSQSR